MGGVGSLDGGDGLYIYEETPPHARSPWIVETKVHGGREKNGKVLSSLFRVSYGREIYSFIYFIHGESDKVCAFWEVLVAVVVSGF
jgi:hypothetical protein